MSFSLPLIITLHALFSADLDSVHSQVSLAICKAFALCVHSIHSDTTSLSFYGAYELAPTAVRPDEVPSAGLGAKLGGQPLAVPQITYGYSKQHRPDLKQLVVSLSVSDEQIPLFGSVLDGNTADATTYLAQWLAVSGIVGHSDFLFLGTQSWVGGGSAGHNGAQSFARSVSYGRVGQRESDFVADLAGDWGLGLYG